MGQWGRYSDAGDGASDLTVYRPSTGYWYILKSGTNFTTYLALQ